MLAGRGLKQNNEKKKNQEEKNPVCDDLQGNATREKLLNFSFLVYTLTFAFANCARDFHLSCFDFFFLTTYADAVHESFFFSALLYIAQKQIVNSP